MTTVPEIPAVSVALVRGDKVLLVERGRPPSQGLFAFPGGKVEPGETLEEAARRELAEETTLGAAAYRPVRSLFIEGARSSHPHDYRLTVFAAEYGGGEAVAGDDAASAAFYSLAEMHGMKLTEGVLEIAKELLGHSLARNKLPGEKAP